MAAKYGVPVVCQKPIAFSYEDCIEMRDACKTAGVPFIINENYRWQSPIRQIKAIIDSGKIGTPFRSQIQLSTGGPFLLQYQPFLKTLRHYVIFDLGVHAFDVARYLFGEPDRIYCQALRTVDFIRGDDMASAILTYKDSICSIQLTDMISAKIQVEGLKGLIELTPDYQIRITTKEEGVQSYDCTDWKRYAYMEPEDEKILGTDVVDAIVQAQRNILEELRYGKTAETSISEYIKTMEIAFNAIQSTITGNSIPFCRY
jgi:predicted dehydrogenase